MFAKNFKALTNILYMLKTPALFHYIWILIVAAASLQGNDIPSSSYKISYNEGFFVNTLIKTPHGSVQIQDLQENDVVMSYDFINSQLQTDRVVKIITQEVDKVIEICIGDSTVVAGLNQKFYILRNGKQFWIKAKNIRENDFVLTKAKAWKHITHVAYREQKNRLYLLSTQRYHNFLVQDEDILVHNIVILAIPILGFNVTLSVAAPLVGSACMWLYSKVTGNHPPLLHFNKFTIKPPSQNDWNHFLNNKLHDHKFNDKDPKKIWDFAYAILLAGINNDQIKEGLVYKVNGATQYGILEVTGKAINGIVHIGTMYLKDI